jgi:hypothetical protein
MQPQSVPENLVKQHMDLMEVPHAIHVVCARMGPAKMLVGAWKCVARSSQIRCSISSARRLVFGIPRMLRYVGIAELRDGRIGGASLLSQWFVR